MVKNHLPLCIITSHLGLIIEANRLQVDRVMIDLERLGKAKRQQHVNLFLSNHCEVDIATAKSVLTDTRLMVRVNPLNKNSKDEIDRVIDFGADIVMLPYFSMVEEVIAFIQIIAGRCKTNLLIETKGAIENINTITSIEGVDEIHVGLNDLQLSLQNSSLFDVLFDGTLEKVARITSSKNIRFGYGGVAPTYFPMTFSPEAVIAEQIRFQSKLAILSRKVTLTLENYCDQLVNVLSNIEMITQKWQSATPIDFMNNRMNF